MNIKFFDVNGRYVTDWYNYECVPRVNEKIGALGKIYKVMDVLYNSKPVNSTLVHFIIITIKNEADYD